MKLIRRSVIRYYICSMVWEKMKPAGVHKLSLIHIYGVYTIRIRYRAPSATVNTVDMYINNTKVGTPEFAQTDNDKTVWNTALMSVSLRKGANTFELKANSSGAGDLYLDNIVIERK